MSETVVLYILKVVFFIFIPLLAIIAVIKKKIKAGFAIGIFFASFLFGLMVQATFVRVDPVAAFMRDVNYKNYEEAKRSYKIVIQYGSKYLQKIKYDRIIDPAFFKEIQSEVAAEYKQLAMQYYTSSSFDAGIENHEDAVDEIKEKLSKLKHALKLIAFSESIDYPLDELKEKIQERITAGESLLQQITPVL